MEMFIVDGILDPGYYICQDICPCIKNNSNPNIVRNCLAPVAVTSLSSGDTCLQRPMASVTM